MKNQKTSNRFEMLRDVLDEKSENSESFTDTPTTLTDNAEETIMIKGRVSRAGCIFRVDQLCIGWLWSLQLVDGQLRSYGRTQFMEP